MDSAGLLAVQMKSPPRSTVLVTNAEGNPICRRERPIWPWLEVIEYLLHQPGGERVGAHAAGAGNIDADGFDRPGPPGAAAEPGLQDGVVLDGLLETLGALADLTAQAAEAPLGTRTTSPNCPALGTIMRTSTVNCVSRRWIRSLTCWPSRNSRSVSTTWSRLVTFSALTATNDVARFQAGLLGAEPGQDLLDHGLGRRRSRTGRQ